MRRRVPQSVIELIGNTPMVELRDFAQRDGIHVYAKLEWHNATGSVKARPALQMVVDGRETGRLSRGMTVVEATSGNTGTALAMVCTVLGYSLLLVIPESTSVKKQDDMRTYGAQLEIVPGHNTELARETVSQMVRRAPHRYFWPDQYSNPSNWKAHYLTTGLEILAECPAVTDVVAAQGSFGTLRGTAIRLREALARVRDVRIHAVVAKPGSGTVFSGIKDVDRAALQPLVDDSLLSSRVLVSGGQAAKAVRRALEYGYLIGPSAGAVLYAAGRIARAVRPPARVVCILADAGDKYPGHPFYGGATRLDDDDLDEAGYASW